MDDELRDETLGEEEELEETPKELEEDELAPDVESGTGDEVEDEEEEEELM